MLDGSRQQPVDHRVVNLGMFILELDLGLVLKRLGLVLEESVRVCVPCVPARGRLRDRVWRGIGGRCGRGGPLGGLGRVVDVVRVACFFGTREAEKE